MAFLIEVMVECEILDKWGYYDKKYYSC